MMVGQTPQNRVGPINLFDEKEPHHLMGECHTGKRYFSLRGIIDARRESIRPPDEENQSLGYSQCFLSDVIRKLVRCHLPASFVEQDKLVSGLKDTEDGISLFFLLRLFCECPDIFHIGNFAD